MKSDSKSSYFRGESPLEKQKTPIHILFKIWYGFDNIIRQKRPAWVWGQV